MLINFWIMDDYGDGDDNAYSAFDDPYASSDDATDDATAVSDYSGDDEMDMDVLDDFALPDEDLNGLHIVEEGGNEPDVKSEEATVVTPDDEEE